MKKPLSVLLIAAVLAGAAVAWFVAQGTRSDERQAEPPPVAPTPATEPPRAELAVPQAPAAASDDEETVAIAEGRQEVAEPAASNGTRTRDHADADWLEGRVALPPDTPSDERVLVLSLARAMQRQQIFKSGGPALAAWEDGCASGLLDWAVAEPDGRFRIAVPAGEERAHLAVSGRYLFSAASTEVSTSSPRISLPAELGGWITGRLVAPSGAGEADAADELEVSGIELEIGPDITAGFDTFELASSALTQKAETDAQGGFEFRGVSPASVVGLLVRPEQLAAKRLLGIEVEPGQRLDLAVSLDRGATLLGQVTGEGGEPIEDAKVAAMFRGPIGQGMGALRETKTDAKGQYELAHVALGDLDVFATHDGYVAARQPLEKEALRDGGRLLGIDLVLGVGATITGRVTFPDGTPAAEAEVRAQPDLSQLGGLGTLSMDRQSRGKATTSEDGAFTIRGLSDGRYVVRATRELESGEREGDWSIVARNVVAEAEPLELVLERLSAMRGRVVDGDGEPVESFRVMATLAESGGMFGIGAERESHDFSDEPEGRFEMEGLQQGVWEVRVQAEGFATSAKAEVTLPQAGDDLRFVLLPAARVAGQVLDTAGQPVSGARVTLRADLASRMEAMGSGREPSAFSDAEGAFVLEDLDPGSVSLVASLDGFAASEAVPCEVAAGELVEGVVLRLRVGGRLTGEVMNEDGDPWPGRMVILQRMPDFTSQHMLQSDEAGRFEADNLEPGSWQVVATVNFMQGELGEGDDMGDFLSGMLMDVVDIVDGESTHVVLGTPPADPVLVRGRVMHDGEPVADSMVSFVPEGGDGLAAMKIQMVDEDGRFETELDHPGAYRVTVNLQASLGQQHSVEFLEEVPDDRESVDLLLELEVGRISGRVFGVDGEPAADCRVTLHVEDGMAFGSALGGRYAETATDEDGRYDLPFLRPGTYSVAVGGVPMGGLLGGESRGGRIVQGGIEVAEGEHVEHVDFHLARSGEIAGTVRDAGGNPVAEATVFVRDENGRLVERFSFVVTDASGKFTYKGLAEGAYRVVAKEGDRVSQESERVQVSADHRGEVAVALEEGTVLRISVEDLEDLRDARVQVLDDEGIEVSGMWSISEMMEISRNFSSKEQRVGPLPPGKYTVILTAADGRTTKKPVTLRGTGERKLKLRLR